jgi:hypothetical protein
LVYNFKGTIQLFFKGESRISGEKMKSNFKRNSKIYPFFLFVIFVLAACTPALPIQTPIPLQTITPSATVISSLSTPSLMPTAAPAETITPSPIPTQFLPAEKPSPSPTVEPLDPFPVLKPGQYLLYIHEPLPTPDKSQSNLTIISLDSKTKVEWNLPLGWGSGRPRLSPDRKTLAFVGSLEFLGPSFAALMDVESGKIRYLDRSIGHFDNYGVAWSPDGKYLAASSDHDIQVISVSDGKRTVMKMECLDLCFGVEWSPDGKWLSYAEGDFMLRDKSGIFLIGTDCLDQPETCYEHKRGPISPNDSLPYVYVGWSPDGKYFAAAVGGGSGHNITLDFINALTGKTERKLEIPNSYLVGIDAMTWSPDGEWIAYAQQIMGVYLTRAQGGAPIELAKVGNELITLLQWISVPQPFAPGSVYTITSGGAYLNLRAQPALDGKVLKVLPAGEAITILEGPTQAGGYTWWHMRARDGTDGWAVDIPDWYAPISMVTSPTP